LNNAIRLLLAYYNVGLYYTIIVFELVIVIGRVPFGTRRNSDCRNNGCRNNDCRNNGCRNNDCRNNAMEPHFIQCPMQLKNICPMQYIVLPEEEVLPQGS